MRKTTNNVFAITIPVTALFAFTLWELLSRNRISIEERLEISQAAFIFWEYIVGMILSYGFYVAINKAIIFFCNRIPIFKRYLLGRIYFEGTWGGGYYYKNEIRLFVLHVEQNFDGVVVDGSVYSLSGMYIGDMDYKSVDFDIDKRLFFSTYTATTINREYSMEGLYRGKFSLDKHKKPSIIEGYAIQSGVDGKQNMLFYKFPRDKENADLSEQLAFIKDNHLAAIKTYLHVPD